MGIVALHSSLSGAVDSEPQRLSTLEEIGELSGNLSLHITNVIVNKDYNELDNLPTINGRLVKGDLTSSDLGIKRGYDATIDPHDDEHLILTT